MELTGIKEIANIGAGTMGHAIALQFAMNGYNVKVYDREQTGLQRGKELISHDLKTFVDAGMVTEKPEKILSRLTYTTNLTDACQNADFVIESIVEKRLM